MQPDVLVQRAVARLTDAFWTIAAALTPPTARPRVAAAIRARMNAAAVRDIRTRAVGSPAFSAAVARFPSRAVERALARDLAPIDFRPQLKRVRQLLADGRKDAALAGVDRLAARLERRPGKPQRMLIMDNVWTIDPLTPAAAYAAAGAMAFIYDDPANAARYYDRARAAWPDAMDIHLTTMLGLTFQMIGRSELAADLVQREVRLREAVHRQAVEVDAATSGYARTDTWADLREAEEALGWARARAEQLGKAPEEAG